tara:strand:+ start:224 stop:559 length:336 start_codon:yes stop_codon:yes gene_type:complete
MTSTIFDRILCVSKDGKRIGYKKNKKQTVLQTEHVFTTVSPNNTSNPTKKECSICCGEISSTQGRYITKCNHEYHLECILPWFMKTTTCPLCRSYDIKNPLSFELVCKEST